MTCVLMGGCGGSNGSVAAPRSTSTSSSAVTLPPDVNVALGTRVLAHGEMSGVRWFYSEYSDPTMGTCREFDFDPPIRRVPFTGTTVPGLIIGGGGICQEGLIRLPSNPADVALSDPVVAVQAERSQDGAFSVLSGVAAPGVIRVIARYADGVEVQIAPGSAHEFLLISRPSRPNPASLTVEWSGGRAKCDWSPIDHAYYC